MKNKRKKVLVCFLITLIMGMFIVNYSQINTIKAAEIDRDPMENGRMSPMEEEQEDFSSLLRSGSNDYVAVTGVKNGVDVSKWQGNIDWNAVKSSGIEYALIRVGYRGMDQGTLAEDPYYKQNIEQATAAGIKVGVYIFSQAINVAEAEQEADYIVSRIRNYNITMPVVIDYEFGNGMTGRLANANLSKQAGTDVCNAFCARVESQGYTGMVYANKNMLTNYVDGSQIANQYLIWLAQYNTHVTYSGNYNFWQYCSDGAVSGIQGNVDMNYWYIKDGVEDFSINGLYYNESMGWVYYKNGSIDTSYTGVASNQYGLWYVKDGIVDFSYTGLAMATDGKWYYVQSGGVDTNYTGMVHTNDKWWKIVNGQVDLNYNDLYDSPQLGWIKIENGRMNEGYNDLYNSPSFSNSHSSMISSKGLVYFERTFVNVPSLLAASKSRSKSGRRTYFTV